MLNKLPPKARAKAIRSREDARNSDKVEPIDWLGLWAISLGIAALVLASTAYFAVGDNVGAAFILAGAAALISIVLAANKFGHF